MSSIETSEPRTAGLDRVPPQSIHAEACVLAAMILHSPSMDVVVQILPGKEYFYRPAHQTLFETLLAMREARKPVDLVTVRDELARLGLLESVGGIEYVAELVEGLPDAANVEYYATTVRDKALLRELILAGTEMTRDAYDSTDDPVEVINQAEARVFKIAQRQVGQQAVGLGSLLNQAFESLQEHEGKLITGLATGYDQFDELTSGLQKGEMIILAARPSMGKTSLLLNLAENMAVRDGVPIGVFSLEMSKEQLTQRFLASYSRFNLRQMRRGMISPESWTALQAAAGDLAQAPIYIDDSPMLTPMQLRAKARRLSAAHQVQCIFIDYLTLLTYSGRSSTPRHEQITEISRSIKALARELEIPVVCAAQLNRGPTDRPSHRPRMSDLRESGSIEQDADVVTLLHREDYYHQGEEGYLPTNVTDLIIAKQRNGPTGIVSLVFNNDITRFEQAAPDSYIADPGM